MINIKRAGFFLVLTILCLVPLILATSQIEVAGAKVPDLLGILNKSEAIEAFHALFNSGKLGLYITSISRWDYFFPLGYAVTLFYWNSNIVPLTKASWWAIPILALPVIAMTCDWVENSCVINMYNDDLAQTDRWLSGWVIFHNVKFITMRLSLVSGGLINVIYFLKWWWRDK